MTYFNPISGAVLPGALAQQQLATEKTKQLRRTEAARRNVATGGGDHFEHTVESAEAVSPVSDEKPREEPSGKQLRRNKSKKNGDKSPHLDVKA